MIRRVQNLKATEMTANTETMVDAVVVALAWADGCLSMAFLVQENRVSGTSPMRRKMAERGGGEGGISLLWAAVI